VNFKDGVVEMLNNRLLLFLQVSTMNCKTFFV